MLVSQELAGCLKLNLETKCQEGNHIKTQKH